MPRTTAPRAELAARRAGWLTALAVASVVAAGGAGLVGIALARRSALEEGRRAFESEAATRARAIEDTLTAARADLAFLAASSPLARLEDDAASAEGALRRSGAESALLLYLRGHPEVVRVAVRSSTGDPLIHTGRRGGIPVLWVSANPTGREGAAVAPDRPRVATVLALGGEHGTGRGVSVETEVEPAALLGGAPADEDGAAACALHDGGGRVLARPPRRPAMPEARQVHAQRPVKADNWSPAGPWALRCAQAEGSLLRLAEPVAARYRATLALNVALMALALLLGGFAVQQLRRRERLESAAREEARVRELERQLFHAERLKTVGRLAAGIAHEINNPLEGMANYLALAREALERGETADGGRHLASVKEGLERAAAVVRQVLAHADPDKAPLVPCDLNQVLRDIGRFVETRRDFAAIDFTFDLPAEPLLVHGSPVMLGQVAVNLVLNACEAQPRGGEVRISSHRENGSAVAEFADRGPGVPEPDRQRIFEPFYSTKDTTGLGLSICHSIVRQHEGELSVHPRAGGGALFRMRLPALEG